MPLGLQVGLLHHIEVIDPHRSLAHASGLVERQIFECLYRWSDGELVSEFFTADLVEVDGAYETQLREDLRWSNGDAITPEDVCESLRRCGSFPEDATIEHEGQRIRLQTGAPLRALRETLSIPGTALVKSVGNGDGEKLIGSGPYRRDDGVASLRLIRNEEHAGPRAPIASIDFVVFENEVALGEALAKGLIDFTVALSPKELPAGSFVRTTYLPTPSTALMWINCERLPDSRLRRAIGHGVDRRRLLSLSYPGAAGLSADSSLPDSVGHCDDQLEHLPSVARELLAEEGVRPDRPLVMRVIWGPRPYLPDPMATARDLARQLAEYGIELSIERTRDPIDYGRCVTEGDFDLALGGWYADDPAAFSFLRALYAKESIPSDDKAAGRCNFGRYHSPGCDLSLQKLRDDPLNQELIDRIGEVVRKDSPTLALHHGAVTVALGRRIRGREFDQLGFPWFASFTLSKS